MIAEPHKGIVTIKYPDGRTVIKKTNKDSLLTKGGKLATIAGEQDGYNWEDVYDAEPPGGFPAFKVEYHVTYQISDSPPIMILNVINAWVSLSNYSDFAPDYGGDPYNGTLRTQSIIGSAWWPISPLPNVVVQIQYNYIINAVYQRITNGQVWSTYTRQYDRSSLQTFVL